MEIRKYGDDITGLPNRNVIYCLCDPISNHVRYIGKTIDLYKRIKNHYKLSELKYKTHKNTWLLSLLKKGYRAKILVIEECENDAQLNNAEIKWIKYYREMGCDLTNSTDGGTGGRMLPESLEKMINSKKGRNLSEYHKKHISEGHMGKIPTNETKSKIGNGNRGKIVSEETKKKQSLSHIKQIPWNKGMSPSNETKIKMRISRLKFLNKNSD